MLTVLSIFGTHPEAIKMAPVVHALARRGDVDSVVCSTGQHRELLPPVLELFGIHPDFELDVMTANQSLASLTARLLDALDEVIEQVKPDWVLAQGDTTTVFCAAIAAFYRRTKFGHVEAGLRTGDLSQPFPEELNRRMADKVATLLFAPTQRSRRALLDEGFADGQILLTGNTVVDALRMIGNRPYDWSAGPLANVPLDRPLVLVTAHRRESFGEPLEQICRAVAALASRFAETVFVLPVHPNPNVKAVVHRLLAHLPNVRLLRPLDYHSLVQLMQRSRLILTDSGGIQEEAPGLGVPALVLRDVTERPEGIEAGVAKLVGTSTETIVREATRLLTDEPARLAMCRPDKNPYGDGHAAERIVAAICDA